MQKQRLRVYRIPLPSPQFFHSTFFQNNATNHSHPFPTPALRRLQKDHASPKPTALLTKTEDPTKSDSIAAKIRNETTVKLADGLELTLWASDSLSPDPVSIAIDDQGRAYITRTVRQKHSEFDIRGYQHWMTESISWQTVEERRDFLRKTFAPEKSKQNEWLADLNNDGSHDWKDLTVEKDEILALRGYQLGWVRR